MKNSKRLASRVLILALLVSVLGLSAVASGSASPTKQDSPAPGRSSWGEIITTNLPTLKDDGIDGSNMKPGSPAFGNYTISSPGNEMTDIGILSTTVYNDTVYVPKNKTGNEGKRIATFKLQEDEDRVRVTFISSQDKDAMNQINVSLANYSSGTVISWYPGLEVGDTATFNIDDPSYTDYYAVYVSTNQTPTNAKIKIVTR